MQFQMVNIREPSLFQGAAGAIQRAAIYRDDLAGLLGFDHQKFDSSSNTGQAGHLPALLLRQRPRGSICEFARIRTAGTRINNDAAGLGWLVGFRHIQKLCAEREKDFDGGQGLANLPEFFKVAKAMVALGLN